MGLSLSAGQSLFLDTAPLIYLFEEHDQFLRPVEDLLDQAYALQVQMVTSLVTYIEILTLPTRLGDSRLAARYRDFLTNSENLSLYPINLAVADEATRLRADYGLRTPDAIQMATARVCGADVFVTNDRALNRVAGLDVVVVSDLLD